MVDHPGFHRSDPRWLFDILARFWTGIVDPKTRKFIISFLVFCIPGGSIPVAVYWLREYLKKRKKK